MKDTNAMQSDGSTDIVGLGEQIFANVALPFPAAVQDHLHHHKVGIVKPNEILGIAIADAKPPNAGTRCHAFVVYGNPMARGIAVSGPSAESVTAARAQLLAVTAGLLSRRFHEAG